TSPLPPLSLHDALPISLTLTISNTGGTDHVSFDAVGLPGFQFIQDPIEYWSRTHHANMDLYDHASADDLKQCSVIIASFIYNARSEEHTSELQSRVDLV